MFNFDVRHIPGAKHGAADGLSRRRPPRTADREDEADIDDFIDAELNPIYVCPVSMSAEPGT